LPPMPNLLAMMRKVHSCVQTVVNTQLHSLFNPDSDIMSEKREIIYSISYAQKFLTHARNTQLCPQSLECCGEYAVILQKHTII
ncbi:17909_t:CDS:2, partial [Acaulospora morrowiae]